MKENGSCFGKRVLLFIVFFLISLWMLGSLINEPNLLFGNYQEGKIFLASLFFVSYITIFLFYGMKNKTLFEEERIIHSFSTVFLILGTFFCPIKLRILIFLVLVFLLIEILNYSIKKSIWDRFVPKIKN